MPDNKCFLAKIFVAKMGSVDNAPQTICSFRGKQQLA